MANANVNIKVGYTLDKTKWSEIDKALRSLSVKATQAGSGASDELKKAATAAREMSTILNSSFSKDLGTVNITKFAQQIVKSNVDIGILKKEMSNLGPTGVNAFNAISSSILGTSVQIKQTSGLLDRMAVTFKNTIRYGISSSIWNNFANSFQKAFDYARDLNKSLNDIRIVTKASTDQMNEFAVAANEASKRLGTSTLDYTNAALIYYQQGLDDQVAQARAEVTLKAANVTGQSASEVSEMLTAVWNGYQVSAAESEKYVDKLAAVAAHSASNLEELSTGMSKVASAANTMGVDIDQLNAQISTIISVTRQAPESVGVALKTIYARMGDIEAGLDDETTLGNYTEKMAQMGVNVLNANGQLRDMGDVIEEIGNKWESMSREQQVALSQTMAGTRQYNNLLALFDNWDAYTRSIEISRNATGELQKQQDIYMESTEAHLKRLKATWQDLYDSAINDKEVHAGIDLLTDTVQVLDNFVDSFGGGIKSLAGLGAILSNVFNKQLSQSITNYLVNQDKAAQNIAMLEQKARTIQEGSQESQRAGGPLPKDVALLAENQTQLKYAKELQTVEKNLTQEQYNQAVQLQTQLGALEKEAVYIEEMAKKELERALGSKEETNAFLERVNIEREVDEELKNQLDEEEAILKAQKEQLITAKSIFDIAKTTTGVREDRNKINDFVQKTSNQELKNAWKNLDFLNVSKEQRQRILDLIQQEINKQKESIEVQSNSTQEIRNKVEAQENFIKKQEEAERIRMSGSSLADDFENIIKYGERATTVSEKVITVTTSLSSLAMAWSSVNSLFQTWSDENASFGDKILQTFMTLGMVIPNVIKIYKDLNAIEKQRLLTQQKQQVNEIINQTLSQAKNKNLSEEIILQKVLATIKEKNLALDNPELIKRMILAIKAQTGAEIEQAGATWSLKASWDALKTTMMAHPLLLIATTIAAATSIIVSAIQAHTKAVKENNDEQIKNSNEIQNTVEKNLELYDSWIKLYEAYKKNNTTKEDLDKKTLELTDSLGEENTKVLELTGNYTKLNEKILELRKTETEKALQSAELERDAAASNVKITAKEGRGKTDITGKRYAWGDDFLKGNIVDNPRDTKYFEEGLRDYASISHGVSLEGSTINQVTFDATIENYIKFYDDLVNITTKMDKELTREELEASEGYEEARSWIAKMKDSIEEYKQSLSDITKYQTQIESLKLTWTDDTSWKEFKDNREKLVNNLIEIYKKEGKTEKEAQEQAETTANTYLESLNSSIAANVQKQRAIEELVKKLGEENREIIEEELSKLSEDDIKYIVNVDTMKSFDNIRDFLDEVKQRISKYKITAEIQTEFKDKGIKIENEAFETFVENLKTQNDMTGKTTKELINYNEQTEKVAKYIVEANNALEDLNKTWEEDYQILQKNEIETQDYAEAFTRVRKAMKDILGIEVDDKFVTEHFEDLQDILNGDLDKIKELRKEFALIQLGEIDTSGWDESLLKRFEDLKLKIEEISGQDFEFNAFLDNQQVIDSLNAIGAKAEWTAADFQKAFGGIGFEPEIDYKNINIPVPEIKYMDGVPIPSLKTQTVQVPYVKSAQYKGTTTTSPSSSKKTGGGGGSSSKQKTEKLEGEADRYHDVNIQLELISNELKKIDKQRDKLLGNKLIDNLNKKISLLNKQMDTIAKKIKIAQGEANELRNKLAGKGVSFNPDGTIANYTKAYNAQLNYTNEIIERYNNMSARAQKRYQDTMNEAKEDFDNFVNNISRYDELISNMIPDLEADIQEAVDQKIDLEIEKFDMSIEIRLDLKEAELDWNEFKKKIIDNIQDDDILGNAMAKLVDFNSYYKENDKGIIQALRNQVDNTLAELNEMDKSGWSKVYGDNRVKALEDLKNYYDELADHLMEVADLQKEVHESYMEMMDETQDKFDKQIESYESISDIIDHDMKVISLFYGEESYSKLSNYFNKQQENNNAQLAFQRQQVEFWKAQMDTLDETTDEWAAAKDKYSDALKDFNDFIEKSIQNVEDKYINAIKAIFQELNNQITNGQGLNFVEEEWNLINKNADAYLDNINSMFETQKLESKYLEALDQTDDINAQRQLKALMDSELKTLREKDKLTQYDIDRANKRYELMLKEIALQEAQQNKNKMRLRRDSQGNYRYEYVADNDQVNQLKDEVDDLYNSLYNFDKEQYKNNLDTLFDTWNEFQEKMADAAQINDPVARAEKEALIREQYGDLINGLVAENEVIRLNLTESAFDDLSRLYDKDSQEYLAMIEKEKNAVMEELVPYWDTGVQSMADNIAGEGGLVPTCEEAFEELNNATQDYVDSLQEIEHVGEISFETIGDGLDPILDATRELINDNDELINKYNNELAAIQNVINQLDELCNKYDEAKNKAIEATDAAYTYWHDQQEQSADSDTSVYEEPVVETAASPVQEETPRETYPYGKVSDMSGNIKKGNSGDKVRALQYALEQLGFDTGGIDGKFGNNTLRAVKNFQRSEGISADGIVGKNTKEKFRIKGFDTGGYTGSWDNSGRLAVLHQKELVLNAKDTENMLNAISIMRNITAMVGAANMNKLAMAASGSTNAPIQQSVHIDASFPGVKDAKEIENALNNLVNMASMRANKR